MSKSDNITIYVVSHRKEDIETSPNDDLYTPLFVGRNGQDNYGFCSDDTGDNICNKNRYYSELTGLYWMCKNSPSDIIGLIHYRRLLAKSSFGKILSKEDVQEYLKDHDLIVPKKTERLEGCLYDSFKRDELYKAMMDAARESIEKLCPEYLDSYDKIFFNTKRTTFFNMFIGPKDLMNNYCDWIFPILDNMVENYSVEGYNRVFNLSNERIYGCISEMLFNVWIEHNNLTVKEAPIKYKGFKLKTQMFIYNLEILRMGYKHIWWPLKKDKG